MYRVVIFLNHYKRARKLINCGDKVNAYKEKLKITNAHFRLDETTGNFVRLRNHCSAESAMEVSLTGPRSVFPFLVLQIPAFPIPGFLVPRSFPHSFPRFPVPCFTDSHNYIYLRVQ